MKKPVLDFGRNSSLLLARLESGRIELCNARTRVQSDLKAKKEERILCVNAHVRRLLPNAQSITFTRLARELPIFMSRNIQSHVAQWQTLRVPFLTQLFGGANRFRSNAEKELLDLICARLKAYLDSLETYPDSFGDLFAIDQALGELYRKDANLAEQEAALRKQIATLSFTRTSTAPVPEPYARAVQKAADSRGPVVDDDLNLIVAMIINQDVLASTFSYDQSGAVADYHPDVFTPGEGNFGGGGAKGSWDSPTELMASHNFPDTPVVDTRSQATTFDDASVAGLGSIS